MNYYRFQSYKAETNRSGGSVVYPATGVLDDEWRTCVLEGLRLRRLSAPAVWLTLFTAGRAVQWRSSGGATVRV